MMIDCETCAVRDLACADCVVTVLLRVPGGRREPAAGSSVARLRGIDLDQRERVALAVLAGEGLVPPLRLVVGLGAEPESPRKAG